MRKYLILLVAANLFIFAQADDTSQKAELEKTIENRQTELENIKNTLDEKRINVDKLKSEEKQHQKKLYAVEEQLSLSQQLIGKIGRQIQDTDLLIAETEETLKLNEQNLEYYNEIMNQRLVFIYKRSRISPLISILSSEGPAQAARRIYMSSLLNAYDHKTIAEIESLTVVVAAQKTALENQRLSITGLKQDKEQQARLLAEDRKSRKGLLKEVRTQKDAELKAIEQLSEDQNRIATILETLFENRKIMDKSAAAAFENLKGKLLWPVQGKIIRQFGKIKDTKYNTVVNSPGIDIDAAAGKFITASSSGEVAYISWLRGYGSFIILDHGGGYYSLYAHLDDILVETGQFITAGESIATVGETGSLSGPMLHFELRYGKEQLDPVPWLR